MSLQVWLPLNGDLHNQGLSNIQFINNGATVDINGKIGKCYLFNGSNNFLKATYNFYNNIYSVCTWVYSTSSTATQTICCDRTATGSGFSIFLIGGKLRIDPGGNNLMWTTNYTYPINTWFHLTITYDGTNVFYYINGEYKEKKAFVISSSYWGNTTSIGASQTNNSNYGNYLNGKLNDVRIYNHCLSAKEVEEISKGLVLHYKLNQTVLTKYDKNLYIEPDGSHWLHVIHHNNPAGGLFSKTDSWETGVKKDNNRWYDFACVNLLNNFEFMVKQKAKSTDSEVKYRWIQTKNPLKAVYDDVKPTSVTRITTSGYTDGAQGGLWKMNSQARLCIANTNSGNWYGALGSWTAYQNGIPGYPNTTITNGYIDLYIRIDELLSIVQDSSGYNNNGIIVGALTAESPSPRYNYSIYMDNKNTANRIETSYEVNIPEDAISVSFWAKFDKTQQMVIFAHPKIEFAKNTTASAWLSQTSTKGFSLANFVTNEWNHIVAIKDGSSYKLYVNGVAAAQSASANNWTHNSTKVYLLNRSYNNTYAATASIVDFRIYATVLTEAQIKELYMTSMNIDGTNIVPRDLE